MRRDPKKQKGSFEEVREQLHRQMLSAVSHDLKTPLATMIGSLEVYTLMHTKLSPEKKDILINAALSEAYRLDNFITNILDMAKLEEGDIRIKPEKVNAKSLLSDCVTRLGPRARLHTINVHVSGRTGNFTTDPILFGRAIGLVLDNAIKHAGKQATIDVECNCDEADIFVRVRDNGQGIPAGKEEEIFSKYTRLARNDQQNAGTGLGLAICRQMMKTLGGSVQAETHPEGGALFTLRLPAAT